MTIACATHFTPSSDEAVLVAAALARQSGEQLLLASVVVAPSAVAHPHLVPRLDQRHRQIARSLELEAERVRLRGLRVEARLLSGPLEASLVDLCREASARLLVLGDSRLRAPTLAAPLERLLEELPVPMLIAHGTRAFVAWAEGRPLEVLLGLDHTWSSALAVRWVSALAAWGPVRVTALHVWSPAGEFTRRGLDASADDAVQARLAVDLHHETEAALETLPDEVTRHVRLELGESPDVAQRLLTAASGLKADLLVVGTHRHQGVLGLVRSVSHEVLSRAPMSLVFVPATNESLAVARSTA